MPTEKIPKLTYSEKIEFAKKNSYYNPDPFAEVSVPLTDEEVQEYFKNIPVLTPSEKNNGYSEVSATEYRELINQTYQEWLENIEREDRDLNELEKLIQEAFLKDQKYYEKMVKQKPDLRVLIRDKKLDPAKVFWFNEEEEEE